MPGADYPLCGSVVAQCTACSCNGYGERPVCDMAARPESPQEFFLRDHSIRVRCEVKNKVEDTPLNRDGYSRTAQFETCRVKFEVFEFGSHGESRVPEKAARECVRSELLRFWHAM